MMRTILLCTVLWMLGCSGSVRAAECPGPYPVALRTLALADGRDVSVWFPSTIASTHGATASVAACASRFPLVLFSHGLAGCGTQAVFITEEIARHGYVVAAPDHHDASCAHRSLNPNRADTTTPSFLVPMRWNDTAWRDRMLDLRETLQLVLHDPSLGAAIDPARVGLMGHSLGGYTVIGMAGGWDGWGIPGMRAVLAFSPYVEPYVVHQRLAQLRIPVMYQGGTLDFGITPSVVRPGGGYAASPAPKYLVELADASHMAWTNWPCHDRDLVSDCLANVRNARLVDAYALAFLDRYLKGRPSPLLDGSGDGLALYRDQR